MGGKFFAGLITFRLGTFEPKRMKTLSLTEAEVVMNLYTVKERNNAGILD